MAFNQRCGCDSGCSARSTTVDHRGGEGAGLHRPGAAPTAIGLVAWRSWSSSITFGKKRFSQDPDAHRGADAHLRGGDTERARRGLRQKGAGAGCGCSRSSWGSWGLAPGSPWRAACSPSYRRAGRPGRLSRTGPTRGTACAPLRGRGGPRRRAGQSCLSSTGLPAARAGPRLLAAFGLLAGDLHRLLGHGPGGGC